MKCQICNLNHCKSNLITSTFEQIFQNYGNLVKQSYSIMQSKLDKSFTRICPPIQIIKLINIIKMEQSVNFEEALSKFEQIQHQIKYDLNQADVQAILNFIKICLQAELRYQSFEEVLHAVLFDQKQWKNLTNNEKIKILKIIFQLQKYEVINQKIQIRNAILKGKLSKQTKIEIKKLQKLQKMNNQ